jgi:hypothetical protein
VEADGELEDRVVAGNYIKLNRYGQGFPLAHEQANWPFLLVTQILELLSSRKG